MEQSTTPRLCGGTFFTLLLQARKQRTSAREKTVGVTDGLSDSDILEALIRVASPQYQPVDKSARNSFRATTSKYKTCQVSSGVYLPFDDDSFSDGFDDRIKKSYSLALSDMSRFTEKYISTARKGDWLANAIIEIVETDDSIRDDDPFFMDEDCAPITKLGFTDITEVSLPALLLSVWHYVIMCRKDNTVGRYTYISWHSKSSTDRAKHEFTSQIGHGLKQDIRVTVSSSVIDRSPYSPLSDVISNNGIAPDLSTGVPIIVMPGNTLSENGEFSEYLHNARNKYSSIKTLLYSDQPRRFYDFYVCNNIIHREYLKKHTYRQTVISNATAEVLQGCSNFIIISGTGGLGKSMMMRHLLLNAVDTFTENGKLPIFIPLKDYNPSSGTLSEHIYDIFISLGGDVELNEFEDILKDGRCLLLFDGMDEISSSNRSSFEHELDLFADRFSKNMFVISSRPFMSFVSFTRFTELYLRPFTKKQALELIDKLDFRSDEPDIKLRFRSNVDENLYDSHRSFIENPLLLTIMLMTFEQFAEVPSKMHIFYHEAYVALSQKHDASKGAYKRALRTGLTADRFADYFAEFCARSYRDEKFDLSELEFEKYYNSLKVKARDNNHSSVSDFIFDLTSNMCLMYYESQQYHFTHRSFQEYFCALYFSKQKDKYLWNIATLFENKRGRNYGDSTFSMLYDMIPDKVEEYIFIPYLKELFAECDSKYGYWTFLEKLYPYIYYDQGEVGNTQYNSPASFLFTFITRTAEIYGIFDDRKLPFYEEFVSTEYAYLDENWRDEDGEPVEDLVAVDEIDGEYIADFGHPEVVGWNLEIDVSRLLENQEEYSELLEILDDPYFGLKEQYTELREYLERLEEKVTPASDDLFDLF